MQCVYRAFQFWESKGDITTYSEIAQARANPSAVDVPLPSSSIMTSESLVADYSRLRTDGLMIVELD